MTSPAPQSRVHYVHNNTWLVDTSAGQVLVHSAPETLKALLAKGYDVPKIVLLPPDMPPGRELGSSGFVRKGINYASIEFILIANYFGQGQKTRVIAPTRHQAMRIRRILQETTAGPQNAASYSPFDYVQRECYAVGTLPSLGHPPGPDDMADILNLEQYGNEIAEGVTVDLEAGFFVFREQGEEVARVDTDMRQHARPMVLAPPRPLLQHELTLQFIGGSDGFDPGGITTCFLAYFRNGNAPDKPVLFDTAAYLLTRLGNLGTAPNQIAEVVLSHLHEDHLAGLPELLLMGEKRVRLITAEIVYRSLLRMLGAMFDMPADDVARFFDYYPLNPGEPLDLDGRRYQAVFAIHSIPTIAVRVGGLYFSGDMRYDEQWFHELEQQGILAPERRQQLLHFADGAKVLVQDAGGGPIHTTVTPALLAALREKGQRIILAHTSRHELPGDDPSLAGIIEFATSGHVTGLGDTQPLSKRAAEKQAYLATISASPLFSRLSFSDRKTLARKVDVVEFGDGETIVRDGEPSDGRTFIVHAGLVEVLSAQRDLEALASRGSSLGERGALMPEIRRTGTLTARGDVQLLTISPALFAPLAEKLALHDAFHRADWLWHQPLFRDGLWSSLLDLALEFEPRRVPAGEDLFHVGEPGDESYIVVTGAIAILSKNRDLIDVLREPGTYFGGRAVLDGLLRNATARAVEDSVVWALGAASIERLEMVYPKVMMHLRAVEASRANVNLTGTGSLIPRDFD